MLSVPLNVYIFSISQANASDTACKVAFLSIESPLYKREKRRSGKLKALCCNHLDATEEEISESVAYLSIPEIVKKQFVDEDRGAFGFMFQHVKGTDHEFYRDVLHPSIHGDGLHIAMRLRDEGAVKIWVHKCLFHSNQVYSHLTLEFAKSGLVPANLHEYFRKESLRCLQAMDALLNHPRWKGTDERLPE